MPRPPQAASEENPTPRLPLPPWNMYTVAVALMCGFILVPLLVSNILALAVPLLHPPYLILIQQCVTLITWGLIFAYLARAYDINIWPYLGVEFSRPVFFYVKETLRLLVVMVAIMAVLSLLMQGLGVSPTQPYERYSGAELRMIALFAMLTAPIMEELVFRGFVQSTFHTVSPPVRAVIFTTLVFVLFHPNYFLHITALVYVLLLGLVLGYWRERVQSIVPCVFAHLANNVLASLALFFGGNA